MPDLLSRVATLSSPLHLAKLPPRVCGAYRHYHDTVARRSTASANKQSASVSENGFQMKARKHGFKSLPISPLMRTREKTKPKPAPVNASEDEALAEFRKQFAQNPFGRILRPSLAACSPTDMHILQLKRSRRPSASAESQTPTYRRISSFPSRPRSKDHRLQQRTSLPGSKPVSGLDAARIRHMRTSLGRAM